MNEAWRQKGRRGGAWAAALVVAALWVVGPMERAAAQGAPAGGVEGVGIVEGRGAEVGAARAEIEALIGRMGAAAAEGDREGYLSCVWLEDPCFATEQRNWAADLGLVRPERCEVTLEGEDAVKLAADGTAEAKLKWAWKTPGGRSRTVRFAAVFVRGDRGWLYAGEKWNEHKGEGCRVLFEDGLEGVAELVAKELPEIRRHVEKLYGLEGDESITKHEQQIKLYTSMGHLQHSIYLSYSDGLAGWNEPDEAVKILATRRMSAGMLRPLLGHEYGHVATFHMGPRANDMPWWVLEGAAELAAEKWAGNGGTTEARVKRWAQRGRLLKWEQLADFRGEAANHYAEVYAQGHAMLRHVSARFGQEGRNRWLRELAGSAELESATREALGVGFAEIDAAWREGLAKKEEKGEGED